MPDTRGLAVALSRALKEAGYAHSEAAIVLVHRTDSEITDAAMTGDMTVIGRMLVGALQQIIASPLTIEPLAKEAPNRIPDAESFN